MFNIGMENKPYEYTIKHDGIRAPYVSGLIFQLDNRLASNIYCDIHRFLHQLPSCVLVALTYCPNSALMFSIAETCCYNNYSSQDLAIRVVRIS